MTLRKKLRVIVLLMAGVSAGALRAESLGDALVSAYTNSGLLEQNRALLRSADEDVALAVAATMPVINWSIQAQSSKPRNPGADAVSLSARISAELTLFDNGAGQFAIDSRKELVLGTRQSLIGVEQQVLYTAVEAYMNMRRYSEFVDLRQNNVRVISEEFRASQDRFDVGEVTRTDVSLAEARLASAQSLLAAAQGDLARAAEEYRAAIGHAPGRLDPVQPAPVAKSIEEARAFALRNHPNMLELQHAVAANEYGILRAEAAMKPTLSIGAQVGVDQNLTAGRQLSMTLGGPIYNGGRLSALVRQAMAGRDATRASLHVTSAQVSQQVGNAYSFLEVARASRTASEQQSRAAGVAFRGVREEATLGARTTLDVLNAEQEQLNAQANQISAQADEVVASYAVLAAMGLLTASHLQLPVQQYDPAAYYNLVKDAPTITSDQGQALDRVLKAIGQ